LYNFKNTIVKITKGCIKFDGLKTHNDGRWNSGVQSVTDHTHRTVTTTMDKFLTATARLRWDNRGDDVSGNKRERGTLWNGGRLMAT